MLLGLGLGLGSLAHVARLSPFLKKNVFCVLKACLSKTILRQFLSLLFLVMPY
jgi:hypothetical protein